MPEAVSTPEARMVTPPTYIGAVFETGRSRGLIHDWVTGKDIVPVKDVLKDEDREIWILENIRVFSDGTLASPELSWKPVIDFWLAELKVASKNSQLSTEKLKRTEMDLKAMMAVSASARAMEPTSGDAAKYVTFMTVDGDLDKQDSWAEFLLHKDPKKLIRVIENPLVNHYYEKLMEDAGIDIKTPLHKEGPEGEEEWVEDWSIPDKDKVLEGSRLVRCLKGGGLNEYIAEILLEDKPEFIEKWGEKGVGDTARWAAAKLACDAFLVDKYTKWEYELDKRTLEEQEREKKEKKGLKLDPFPGWGGNPLRAILEPSFLPRRIKKVYQKEDAAILAMADEAFRPEKEFERAKIEKKLLPSSMVIHLKDYARYSNALWTFFGSSRGAAIPQWTKKTVEEDLPAIAELLDQVYMRTAKEPELPIVKHVMGMIMARILECKALATAIESARPGFKENMAMLFDIETGRPFLEIERFIWGPLLDARRGLLASFAGGRTRFIFKHNQFGAEKTLRNAWEILSSNDQDPRGRGRAKVLNRIGFILDAVQAIAAGGKRR